MSRVPEDFSMPFVAIMTIDAAGSKESSKDTIADFAGTVIDIEAGRTIARFDRVETAAACARRLQKTGATRIGINLGEMGGPDIAYADRLRSMAESGEIVLSAVSYEMITSRFRPGNERSSPLWWVISISGLSLLCFLAYYIPNSLQNPKILMGYDPEFIGDGISPFCPLLWHSSAKEIEDSVDEVAEARMELVVGHFAVHDSP